MKQSTEQALARHYLVHREGDYSVTYVLRQNRGRYAIQIGFLVLLVIGFCSTYTFRPWIGGTFLFASGMLLGALARDAGWILRIRKQWPFTRAIINWQRVEEIAEGNESPRESGQPAK